MGYLSESGVLSLEEQGSQESVILTFFCFCEFALFLQGKTHRIHKEYLTFSQIGHAWFAWEGTR